VAADPMPTADLVVDEALVRRLLEEQDPDLASLPLTDPVIGWDNVMYRLGTDLAVRLPRRLMSAPLIEREQRWLPELAPLVPLPVPAPIRVGRPGAGYPWSWSVCKWLPGAPAAVRPPHDADEAAEALGAFLRALHFAAPADAPANQFRGVPLAARDDAMQTRVAQLSAELDADAVLGLWSEVLAVPAWTGPSVWLHGDLHPANVLVHEGRISAVIDFGDITSGDPATDLSVAWMMFDPGQRVTLRDAAGDVDDDTWARARGWALALSVAILAGSADNQVMQGIARRTLASALTDA
jgi:aminoglycoside phosphotransferase (APT) family kinase protein